MSDKSQEKLHDQIRKWLDKGGYPLEMTVARALQRAGFAPLQAEYYLDPDTGKNREIDVVADRVLHTQACTLRVSFAIECKTTKANPWIMFCSARKWAGDAKYASIVQRAKSTIAQKLLRSLARMDNVRALPLFQITQPYGYSVRQAFSKEDAPYTAIMGACAAAVAHAHEADELLGIRSARPMCAIAFPVVVIDGRLFTATLTDDMDLSVEEAAMGTLLWRNPVLGAPNTIVHILTLSALDTFAKDAYDSANQIINSLAGDLAPQLAKIAFEI